MKKSSVAVLVAAVLLLTLLVSGCQGAGMSREQGFQRVEEMNREDVTIGINTGSCYDAIAQEQFPACDRKYFNQFSDIFLGIEQEKVDAMFMDYPYYVAAMWEGIDIRALEGDVAQFPVGCTIAKTEKGELLREQMDAFVVQYRESGMLQQLEEKWTQDREPPVEEHPDYQSLTGENGTLRVAATVDLKPLAYLKDGRHTGFEIEFLTEFAREYGYALEMEVASFEAILPGVVTEKYDLGIAGINITDERRESVNFCEPYLVIDAVMAVKGNRTQESGRWFDRVAVSFEKTFIRENRWQLILQGLSITVLITACSAVGGSALGFGLYMAGRTERRWIAGLVRRIAKVYVRIIAGTPVVVVLMILYYVVFGSLRDISGVPVAIIGFCLTFGAFVYEHLTVSVNSVDPGQTEAAYALGYTRNRAFFRIVFPQAMAVFLPSYCGEVVALTKATAVVGYIAVNDLTKVGDIIRSNTYEAFFPLIATAVIYFLLTWAIALILTRLKLRFEPKRRRKADILKGVRTL